MKLATAVSSFVLALAVAVPAWAAPIDPVAVTLTSPADVVARRAALIDETWGTTTLPTTLPTVTAVANPFGSKLPDVGAPSTTTTRPCPTGRSTTAICI